MGCHAPAVVALRSVLRVQELRRALAAFLVFIVIEEAVWLGILLYAHDIGGSAAVGAVAVAQLVPATVAAPVTATWVDGLSVRASLGLAYGAVAVATGLVGLLLLVQGPAWLVVLAAVAHSTVVTLGRPAHLSALPTMAELPSHLVAANAATGTIEALGVLLGPVAVSLALLADAVAPLFAVLAVLLGFAAVLVAKTPLPVQGAVTRDEDEAPEPFLRSATMGVREVRRIPGALALLVLVGLGFVLQGALDVLGVSFAIDVLDAGDQGASAIAAGNGMGLLIGAAAAVVLVGVAQLSWAFVAGAVAGGAAMAAVGLTDTLLLALVFVVLSGFARSFVDVAGRTLLHRNADDRAMARVFGVQEAVLSAGMALGAALAPLAIALVGERAAFVLTGAVFALPALVSLPLLTALDHSGVLARRRIGLLRSLDLFAGLAPVELERLAVSAEQCATAASEVIIEQGADGDCFYAVECGEYRVERDGTPVALLGPGDYFGEIALLRDVPRTASVVCVTAGQLVAVERDVFLTALTRARPPEGDP